jgi:membrane-associated phospholipid phosphatase
MPSGDSGQAGCYLTLLTLASGWRFITMAPLIMMARVYYGCHWIGDTIVGACIGAGLAYSSRWFLETLCRAGASNDSLLSLQLCAQD